MNVQHGALPPRTDLKRWRERAAARLMLRGLDLFERVSAWMLVDVTAPADDPFYRTPQDVEALQPGDVLDSRPVEVRLLRRLLDVDAWQVTFCSTDSHGRAMPAVTTVMVPKTRFDGPVRPLLSYQPAIDSLGPAADPSYTLRRGNQLELPLAARALRRGWAVAMTDYTGPRHAFAAGVLAGRVVLDGIRAALRFGPAAFDPVTPIGLWGYSGGAQATLSAAEQHPSYAPELNIAGVAAGGLPVDPASSSAAFEDVYDGSVLSGIPFGALIGISREFPDVDLLGSLTPEGQAMVAAAADMTVEQLLMSFPFLRWGHYLTVPSVTDIPGLQAAFDTSRLGQATPTAAMYLYHGVHEQNLPIADADTFVEAYRRQGANVSYRRLRFGEHLIVAVTGAPGALRFLSNRFAAARHAPPALGRRIIVTGLAGSGKSTFSLALAAKVGLPVVHLDLEFWKPGWVAPSEAEWREKQRDVLAGEAWIADGNYTGTLDLRLELADTVVVLDMPWWRCAGRALLRGFRMPGELPEGCEYSSWQRLRDEWRIAGRLCRKRHSEPEREREIISEHGQHTARHVLRSRRDVDALLDRLGARGPGVGGSPSPPA